MITVQLFFSLSLSVILWFGKHDHSVCSLLVSLDSTPDTNSYHFLLFGATKIQGCHVQLWGDNSKLFKYTLQTVTSLFFNAASLLTIWSAELTSHCHKLFVYQPTHYRQEENSMFTTKRVTETCSHIIPLSHLKQFWGCCNSTQDLRYPFLQRMLEGQGLKLIK